MIEQRLVNVLAPLASRTYQRQYILNGNKDKYILVDDLLEDVVSFYELAKSQPSVLDAFSLNERQMIYSTLEFVKNNSHNVPENINNDVLVEQNPVWQDICEQAKFCLTQIKVDLSTWEENNL